MTGKKCPGCGSTELQPAALFDEGGVIDCYICKCGQVVPLDKPDKRIFDKTLCPRCCALTPFELQGGIYRCAGCGFRVREEDFVPMQVR
jgi:hypothetical protein